ncbi:MAG TPA: RHS repeat-associated core domain-containing protein, partial [Gemmatimonadaceae bacterium]|nr:RHS repeat-associated core domain-containing protein [Gemmatimonadaceae bacterium]
VLDRHFLWDQDHLLAELDASATQRLGEYAYLPGEDQPFAVMYGPTVITAIQYHTLDEIGNVIGMTGEGSVQAHTSYDDWGVPTRYGNPENRLLFKGLVWEGTYAGLYYVRARWYDPELGRFLSEDPSGLDGGMNYYAFALGDPMNLSDPDGELPILALAAVAWRAYKLASTAKSVVALAGAIKSGVGVKAAVTNVAFELIPGGKKAKPLILKANKAVVIGEGMHRVKAAARSLGAGYYKAWKIKPYDEALSLRRNARWAKGVAKKKLTVYDIGLWRQRPGGRSPNYRLERAIFGAAKHPTIRIKWP